MQGAVGRRSRSPSSLLVQCGTHCSSLPPLPLLTPGKYPIFKYLQYYWSAKSRDGDRRRETLGSQNQSPEKLQLVETTALTVQAQRNRKAGAWTDSPP